MNFYNIFLCGNKRTQGENKSALFIAVLCGVFLSFSMLTGAVAGDQASLELEQAVGTVQTLSGKSYIVRGEDRKLAIIGDRLFQGDTLITSLKSSLGVVFRDDTLLSMGSSSEVIIDLFIFDPAESDMGFFLKMSSGTAQFITGQIGKLAPERMHVETPLSTIGIRGTRFLVKID
jgi:hypothetical protein